MRNWLDVGDEKHLEQILACECSLGKPEEILMCAYKGAAWAMMAEHVFSPITKLKYFEHGTTLLDLAITRDASFEAVHLRLMIQFKSPGFLGYSKDIESDMKIIEEDLGQSDLSEAIKLQVVEHLLAAGEDRDDLGTLTDWKRQYLRTLK